jgi:hypothetical protein
MRQPEEKPKVIKSARKIVQNSAVPKTGKDIVNFAYLKKLSLPEALKFINAIFKAIQVSISTKSIDLEEVNTIYFAVDKRQCAIDVNQILFDRDNLEEFVSYLSHEYDSEGIDSNAFSLSTSPHTCGITEIGNFGALKSPEIVNRTFLELAMYIESFYTTTVNKTGMIQLTLVNKDHLSLIKLINQYLKSSTVINWNNPRSKNDLTTFIWV